MKQLFVLFIFVFSCPFAFAFAGGLGTSEDPFQITTEIQFVNISNNLTAHYVLLNDINISTFSLGDGAWTSLGSSASSSFNGTLDGANHTITGLIVDFGSNIYSGLFGYVLGNISNLRIIDANVRGQNNTGILAGYVTGNITNVVTSGTVNGSYYVGGLVGQTEGSIIHSSSSGSIVGIEYIGGLVGSATSGVIDNSSSSASVTKVLIIGNGRTGGLVGLSSSNILNSFATGTVLGTREIGGLVGFFDAPGIINNSYSTGNVSGTTYNVGGLVGYQNAGTITNSYARGNIVANDAYAGGFVGQSVSGTINNSYATGNVNGIDSVGGFIGYSRNIIMNSYATGNVVGTNYIGGFAGGTQNTITSSYSKGNVTGYNISGGFIGVVAGIPGDRDETTNYIYDSYSTGLVTLSANNAQAGGFSASISFVEVHDSFSVSEIITTGNNSTPGGFAGATTAQTVLDNVYWNNSYGLCIGVDGGSTNDCNATNSANTFFTYSNEPMNNWDFETVWDDVYNESNYPVFQFQNVEIEEDVLEEEQPPTSRGSSSAPRVIKIEKPIEQVASVEEKLRKNMQVQFTHKGSGHSLTLKTVSRNEVVIEIASTPKQYTIKKGETIFADVDDDQEFDLKITFLEGSYYEAKLLIEPYDISYEDALNTNETTNISSEGVNQEELNEELMREEETSKGELLYNTQETNEVVAQKESQEMVDTTSTQEVRTTKTPTWLAVIALMFLLVGCVLGFFVWHKRI